MFDFDEFMIECRSSKFIFFPSFLFVLLAGGLLPRICAFPMATPLRGSVPNTRWPGATLTWEELRSMGSHLSANANAAATTSSSSLTSSSSSFFVPLPPRPTLTSPSPSPSPPPVDPARVRQDDSALTRLLHRGVLTGGYINALLGFADGGPGAARVGAPRGGKRGGRSNSNSNSSRSRNRRSAAPPPRMDPHAAAIEHLRQPRWDFAKEGLSSPDLAEEEAARAARQRKKKTPEEVARGGIVSVRMAWGNAAEAAALRSLAKVLSSSKEKGKEYEGLFRRGGGKEEEAVVSLEEVGMLMVSEDSLKELLLGGGSSSGTLPFPLPPLAASPDALARHSSGSGIGSGEGEEAEGVKAKASSFVEPVEVKCVCPFRLVGRNSARRAGGRAFDGDGSGGGGVSSSNNPFARFELSDPGPRPLPPASAMPQLQLQMLACGSPSALLVSHSATRGGRVWRVAGDDAFLKNMLLVASRVFQENVLAKKEPPVPPKTGGSSSSSSSQTQTQHAAGVEAVMRLADAAVAIAAGAQEVALLPPLEGVDPGRAFLQ